MHLLPITKDGPSQSGVHVDAVMGATRTFKPGPNVGRACARCKKVKCGCEVGPVVMKVLDPFDDGGATFTKAYDDSEARDDHGRWSAIAWPGKSSIAKNPTALSKITLRYEAGSPEEAQSVLSRIPPKLKVSVDKWNPTQLHQVTNLQSNQANGGLNEAGLKRFRALKAHVEGMGHTVSFGDPHEVAAKADELDEDTFERAISAQTTSAVAPATDGPSRLIHPTEARGDSRPVSHDEFNKLAYSGKLKLGAILRDTHPTPAFDSPAHWSQIKDAAFASTREPWGGQTIEPATGKAIEPSDGFAMTIRDADQDPISIPMNAAPTQLSAAMDKAKELYAEKLSAKKVYLGVFRDDDENRIDVDPVTVVPSTDDVDAIGCYTHAIGGAYDFSTGNGHFCPHVAEGETGATDDPTEQDAS